MRTFCLDAGWKEISFFLRWEMAVLASFSVSMNHCSFKVGSMTVPHL